MCLVISICKAVITSGIALQLKQVNSKEGGGNTIENNTFDANDYDLSV